MRIRLLNMIQSIDSPIVFRDDPHLKNETCIVLVEPNPPPATTNPVVIQSRLQFRTQNANLSETQLIYEKIQRNKVWTLTTEDKNIVLMPCAQENTQIIEPIIEPFCEVQTKTRRIYVDNIEFFEDWCKQLARQILRDNIFPCADEQFYDLILKNQIEQQTISLTIDQTVPGAVELQSQKNEVSDLNSISQEQPETIETNQSLNTESDERLQSIGPDDPNWLESLKQILLGLSDNIKDGNGKFRQADRAKEAPSVPIQESRGSSGTYSFSKCSSKKY